MYKCVRDKTIPPGKKRNVLIEKLWKIRGIEWEDSAPSQKELYRLCLKIAWPAIVEGMLLSIINSIDTMMVGSMGSAAIAAVGLTGQPRMILLMLIQSLCAGTTAVVARRRGEEDQEGANACLHQSLTIVTLMALIMAALGYVFAVPFMKFAGANEDTLEMSVTYFRIICLAVPANAWSLCICAGMRAINKTKITMVTNITANLVNVCGNYLLIGGHFGFPALGVKGAAIATATGTVVSCLIAIVFACKKDGYLRLKARLLCRFDKHTMHSLFTVGTSAAAESVFLRIGFLINNKLIAGIGTTAFAANQIVQQITSLSFTVGDGLATAGSALVGQNLGAERRNTAHGIIRIVRRISIFTSIALIILFLLLRDSMPLLFTREAIVISGVSLSFIVVCFGVIPQNGRVVYAGCLRGAGDARFVAICALLSVAIVRPLLTYLFCYPMNRAFPALQMAIVGPWASFVIDAYIRDYLLHRRVESGQWMHIRL